jgi:hypothetical protein
MQLTLNIPIVLAVFAYVCVRRLKAFEAVACGQLRWWQKTVGGVALLCVVLIAINPEFWALGLFGDTAFFDLFVLLLSIQLQMTLVWAWGSFAAAIYGVLRWMISPSPRWSYLLAAWTVGAVANGVYIGYVALRRVAARSRIRPFEGNLCA